MFELPFINFFFKHDNYDKYNFYMSYYITNTKTLLANNKNLIYTF